MMEFKWDDREKKTVTELYSSGEEPDIQRLLSGDWKNPFLIIDTSVQRLWDGRLQPAILSASGLYVMEADEVLKNTFTLAQIWESMSSAGITRDIPVVVIGGGIVCDIGALAASTYLRGMKLMLLPTTLLCMVDACLGGKTGVNMAGAKNQVGTFAPADRVAIMPSFLETLPEREFRSGMAEVVKTALIGDREIRDLLLGTDDVRNSNARLLEIVRRCLLVKGSIVEKDLREEGGRMVLNLGHTIGHALESASGFGLSHGEAVGLGMLAEAGIAVAMGGNSDIPDEIGRLLKTVGLPLGLDGGIEKHELESLLNRDKKTRRDGRIWALPFDWCDCRLV
ncbi:MAG: 3-dehydroquinate synthase, partial [Candidatus Fermentibacteraceae bacterium]|nr:3-dehydroquinate synthase [Candidatus Fermentibacteraceae bacterium]